MINLYDFVNENLSNSSSLYIELPFNVSSYVEDFFVEKTGKVNFSDDDLLKAFGSFEVVHQIKDERAKFAKSQNELFLKGAIMALVRMHTSQSKKELAQENWEEIFAKRDEYIAEEMEMHINDLLKLAA